MINKRKKSQAGLFRHEGFTLIEVLLVAVITVVLMYSMSLIFQKASLVVGMSEAEIQMRQKARDIFGRLEMDLQGAFVDERGEYFRLNQGKADLGFMTTTKQNPEGYMGRTDLTHVAYKLIKDSSAEELLRKKKLIFTKQGATLLKPPPLLVRYSLSYLSKEAFEQFQKDYPGEPYPVRAYTIVMIPDDPIADIQYEDIIADNVTDFRVTAVSSDSLKKITDLTLNRIDTYWEDKIDSRSLPVAVRIRLCMTDTKGMLSRAFENIICPKYSVATEN